MAEMDPAEEKEAKVRRELRTAIRTTVKDMSVTCQNALGLTEKQAIAYVISEAEWVREYYEEQRKKEQ